MRTLRLTPAGASSVFAVVIVVGAAAALWHNLPTPTDVYGPFEVRGELGEAVGGRAVSATVTSVHLAQQVNSVPAAGTWVVVDTTLEAVDSTELPRADLIVGPNSYAPSGRFVLGTLGAEISPGIAQRGSWVFDVAAPLVAPGASETLMLRIWVGTDILDSRLVIDIPANDPRITRIDDMDLARPEMSAG